MSSSHIDSVCAHYNGLTRVIRLQHIAAKDSSVRVVAMERAIKTLIEETQAYEEYARLCSEAGESLGPSYRQVNPHAT